MYVLCVYSVCTLRVLCMYACTYIHIYTALDIFFRSESTVLVESLHARVSLIYRFSFPSFRYARHIITTGFFHAKIMQESGLQRDKYSAVTGNDTLSIVVEHKGWHVCQCTHMYTHKYMQYMQQEGGFSAIHTYMWLATRITSVRMLLYQRRFMFDKLRSS